MEELWQKDVEHMAHLLERALSVGQDLVGKLMIPGFQMRYAAPGTGNDKEMDEMAAKLFNEDIGVEETWGDAARDQVLQWSSFLTGDQLDAHLATLPQL
ncbi:hypothetical protein ACRALDRAFT_1065087 [Sodiomyces alcalophilus JCM 7366]|uniref:uncharacterized protein n=1 Tax=Sodiomyces alcalophilus JCM 7366 TaxID=591952 RepID=UPI0039B537BA